MSPLRHCPRFFFRFSLYYSQFMSNEANRLQEFLTRSNDKHGDRFDCSFSGWPGWTSRVQMSCRQHGSFETSPKAHIHSMSGGCPGCRTEVVLNARETAKQRFLSRAREVHGEQYDYLEVQYVNVNAPITVRCRKHGAFQIRAYKHLAGQGCRQCTYQKLRSERRLPFWEFIERVVSVHGVDKYEYELHGFRNLHSRIRIHCFRHGPFRQSINNHLRGHGCPRCVQSRGERIVREALEALEVEFQEQAGFPECRARRPLRFDFYVPAHRLLIEFDGRQHVENSELWGGQTKLTETQRNDAIKNAFAKQYGFRLLRIPHTEIDRIEDLLLVELADLAM